MLQNCKSALQAARPKTALRRILEKLRVLGGKWARGLLSVGPAHANVEGNEEANKLAKMATAKNGASSTPGCTHWAS